MNNKEIRVVTYDFDDATKLLAVLSKQGYHWSSGQIASEYPRLLNYRNTMVTVIDTVSKKLYWDLPSVCDLEEKKEKFLKNCISCDDYINMTVHIS